MDYMAVLSIDSDDYFAGVCGFGVDANTRSKRKRAATCEALLSPEARLCLIRLIDKFGTDGSFQKKTHDLCEDLDATDKTVRSMLQFLVKRELLLQKKVAGGRGRPISKFVFTEALNKTLEAAPKIGCEKMRPLIHKILFKNPGYYQAGKNDTGNCSSKRKPKHRDFSRANQLLLSVMLYHSNSVGVLSNLGKSRLSKLTGMSASRILSNIMTFKNKQYLTALVPGMTNPGFFGKRSSIYFLNLRHRLYEDSRLPGYSLLLDGQYTNYNTTLLSGHALNSPNDCAPENKRKDWNKLISQYFKGPGYIRFNRRNYLQSVIHKYLSLLLSNHWDNIDASGSLDDTLKIALIKDQRKEIEKELIPLSSQTTDTEGSPRNKILVEFITFELIRQARSLKSTLQMIKEINFDSMDFSVLPPPRRGSKAAIELFPKTSLSKYAELHQDRSDHHYYLISSSSPLSEVYAKESQAEPLLLHKHEISLNQKYEYGLACHDRKASQQQIMKRRLTIDP